MASCHICFDEINVLIFQGYIKRQALYACLTCTPEARTDPTKRAGVCLACSYACHDGHDMVELYTKRNFRCDWYEWQDIQKSNRTNTEQIF